MPRLTRPEQITRHKATAIEYESRVETIRRLRLMPMETSTILQTMTAQWKVKPRMVYHYIEDADRRNQHVRDIGRVELFAEQVAIRRDLRRQSLAAGDFRTALAAAKDEAKLLDCYPVPQVDIHHDWRDDAAAQGIPAAAIEAATEQATTLFEQIATGEVRPLVAGQAVKAETQDE